MFHPAGIVSPIFVRRAWCHLVVETENPNDPRYDGEAVSSLAEAVEAYVSSHPHIDSVDVIPSLMMLD
jgi:hypothetical protein